MPASSGVQGVGIMGHAQDQRGQSCVFLQASWEVRAQHTMVSMVRHCTYTTCSRFFPCPESPGWDVVLDPVCKPHCCWPLFPSLGAPCAGKRCTWQCGEAWLQIPQTAQEHNMLCAKAWRKHFCFGPVYILEVTVPKQICFTSEIQLYPSILLQDGEETR